MYAIDKSLLDACVLAILSKEDTYGYKLTQEIKAILNVSESTLYPVLRRLQKSQYLEVYDKAYAGRNRRYYRLTPTGIQKCKENQEDWKSFLQKINTILLGGEQDD